MFHSVSSALLGRAVVLVTLGGACVASAQSSPQEIVITGNPLGSELTPSAVSTLGRTDLLERGQSTLGETLNGLPGVSSTYFGPNASRPLIRGLDGDRVRLLNNGGSTSDVSALSDDHAVPTDALSVERIEVLRGPAALLYGGSAMGGAVNVIDNRIPRNRIEGLQGQVQLQAATGNHERSSAALLESGQGDWAWHMDAFDRRSGDVQVPVDLACEKPGAASLARRICNSAAQARGGALGFSSFGAGGRLGASVSSYRSDYGTVAEDTVTIDMKSDRYLIEGEWREPLAGIELLKLRMGHTDYRHTESDSGQPQTVFAQRSTDLRMEARHNPLGPLQGVVGLQADAGQFAADGVVPAVEPEVFAPHSRTRALALFAHEEWRTGWGMWNVGVRGEHVSVTSLGHPVLARFVAAERQFSPLSLSGSALYKLDAHWHLKGTLAHSERAPKDSELWANGPHLATHAWVRGDATLGLEKSNSADLGLEWNQGAHRLSATVFQSRFANFIAATDTAQVEDGLPVQVYRGIAARFHGLELNGNWRFWDAASRLDMQWHADAVQAENVFGEPLPRIPPVRIGVKLVHSQGAWSARVGFEHAAAQTRVPVPAVPTGAYTLWSAGLSYRQPLAVGQLHWFANADNLSDQLAYSATSVLTTTAPGKAPLPGRSLKLGVRWQF